MDFKSLVGDKSNKPHALSTLSDCGEWTPSTPQHLERRRLYTYPSNFELQVDDGYKTTST